MNLKGRRKLGRNTTSVNVSKTKRDQGLLKIGKRRLSDGETNPVERCKGRVLSQVR